MKSWNGYRAILPVLLAMFAGSAQAVITCTVTPAYSIVAEGQSVELTAQCDKSLQSVNWTMNTVSVTGNVDLGQADGTWTNCVTSAPIAADCPPPIKFTTPVAAGANSSQLFTMTGFGLGTPNPDNAVGNNALVVVKTAAALAAAAGEATPTTPVNGECKSVGASVSAMPLDADKCSKGKPTLAITNSDSFSWTCASLNGGSDANCYALRGFTVIAQVSGSNGTVSPASQGVPSGGSAIVTASPISSSYSANFTSTCGGTASGNNFTIGSVNSNCTVTASFTNTPVAGQCGSVAASITSPTASCTTGTPSAVTGTATTWNWTCAGINGGATSGTCSATRQYTVSVGSITGGSVSFGSSAPVNGGQSLAFTATPTTAGQVPTFGGDCGVTATANGYQTSARTASCTMTVSFAASGVVGCSATPAGTTVYPATGSEVFPFNSPGLTVDSKTNATKAYQFVNNLASRTSGKIFVERGNLGGGAKNISISACPGDYAVTTACLLSNAETGSMYWSPTGANIPVGRMLVPSCKLEVGKTYYLNVKPVTAGQTVGYILGNI